MRPLADRSITSQPDITLVLDSKGVIEKANISSQIANEDLKSWHGRPWSDVVDKSSGRKVEQIVKDASASGFSAFRQVNQRFPSGLELPIEYTAVRLGERRGLVAIGRTLKAVAELQTRLIAAQQLLERDYWRLREVEARYKLLFDVSNEAVVMLNATTTQIVEANPAALQALGHADPRRERLIGREFTTYIASREQIAFTGMIARVVDRGRAPGLIFHLGPEREAWIVRASLSSSETGGLVVLQFTSTGVPRKETGSPASGMLEQLIERAPDGFVVVDRDGVILKCNAAFLELAELAAKGSVIGEKLSRWLSQPGADSETLISNLQKHRVVRLFPTTLLGELGTETSVEISAAGNVDIDPALIGLTIRNIGRRLPPGDGNTRIDEALQAIAARIGKGPLKRLVQDTVDLVELNHINAVLDSVSGNRTAAAELLGLSRQSLYMKLNRFGITLPSEGT